MMRMMQMGLFPCLRMFDSLLSYLLSFCLRLLTFVKLFDLYYSVSWVLLRPLGGVIFITVGIYYYVLPFVPL
jgi:hypothetical protein